MAAPDIGSCVSAGFNGLKKDPLTHIVTSLLIGIVGGVSAGLLTGPMMVGYMRMIKREDEGTKAEIADVFKGFDDLVPALLAVLVSSIIVGIGFMLCIIPGLLIMALVPTAAYLVAVGEKDGINAIKRAFDAIKENLLSSVLCALVLGIVGSIGGLLCGVGMILTLPIAFIGSYHMAKQLTDGGAVPAITHG
ncbi:MAG: hypothetical protein V4858_23375 [Pseudomonadota bacterium]